MATGLEEKGVDHLVVSVETLLQKGDGEAARADRLATSAEGAAVQESLSNALKHRSTPHLLGPGYTRFHQHLVFDDIDHQKRTQLRRSHLYASSGLQASENAR